MSTRSFLAVSVSGLALLGGIELQAAEPFEKCLYPEGLSQEALLERGALLEKNAKNFIVETEAEIERPRLASKTESYRAKGPYIHFKAHCENYFFKNVDLLNPWLEKKGLAPLVDGRGPYAEPVLRPALQLLLTLKTQVALVQDAGGAAPMVYREMQRYINSPANYYFRASGDSHRVYTGYLVDGNGTNACDGTLDPSWGLDCSGFSHLSYKMAGQCWPRMKTSDLWMLFDGQNLDDDGMDSDGSFRPYDVETIARFFEVTDRPRPGDLVLQAGHIGIYVDRHYMLGMNGNGIGLEVYRAKFPSKKGLQKGRPQNVFLRYKGGYAPAAQACRPYEKCGYCGEFRVEDYFSPNRPVGGNVSKKERYSKPLFYRLENGRVIGRDQDGYGSGANLCEGPNTLR